MQRRFYICQMVGRLALVSLFLLCVGSVLESYAAPAQENGKMTDDDAVRLGEEFGIIVGPVPVF